MPIDSDKLKHFEVAFSSGMVGCRRQCACDKEFFHLDDMYDWEDGEVDRLVKSGATQIEYSVGTVIFEGVEYCMDCTCWHARAEKIIAFVDHHSYGIAEYLTLEKAHKEVIAKNAPVVL